LIAQFLDRGLFGPDISYLRLDGSIAPGDRQALVDRFNADFSIDLLLLTTHVRRTLSLLSILLP
jgi:SNF2 family DNA or RNA helicase